MNPHHQRLQPLSVTHDDGGSTRLRPEADPSALVGTLGSCDHGDLPALSQVAKGGWRAFELRACRGINRLTTNTLWREVFSLMSRLGNGVIWYGLMAVVAIGGGRTGLALALRMVILGIAGLLLYVLIKHLTARPRPCVGDDALVTPVMPLDQYSFPSGHTLHACTFTILCVGTYPILAWVLVPLTLLIMASRLVLGLHYPSDVLAGAVLGGGIGWFGVLIA